MNFIESVIAKYREEDALLDTVLLDTKKQSDRNLALTTLDPAVLEANSPPHKPQKPDSLFNKLTPFRNLEKEADADPIKVFFFILITDMFVGFHSAEGWEVILEGLSEHFGLPANKALVNGFIATVPVVVDACLKFWIFGYLTRYSPTSSAIYERMNT